MDQDFKGLRAEWYGRLKSHGFDDIEDIESPNEFLKQWSSWFQTHYTADSFSEKQTYYQMTRSFLLSYSFESKFEENVWALHSEGFSLREIAKSLETNKDKVNKVVLHLVQLMRNK